MQKGSQQMFVLFFGGFNIVVNLSKTVIQLVKGRQQTNFRKLLYVT